MSNKLSQNTHTCVLKELSALFWIFSALILVPENTIAKSFQAQVVVDSEALFSEYGDQDGVAIDSENLIYFASINGQSGIFKFNAETKTNQLLKAVAFDPSPLAPSWSGRYAATGNGRALLSAKGKLYSSDGTPAGTQLLKDFGSYYCCNSLGSNLSVIKSIDFLAGQFYISTFNVDKVFGRIDLYGEDLHSELWISDGTQQGTKLLIRELVFDESSADFPAFHNFTPFTANIQGKEVVLFFTVNLDDQNHLYLWRRSDEQNIEFVSKFDVGTSFVSESVTNSKGTYLCSKNPNSDQTSLWRISNGGIASKIENGCTQNTLSVNSDSLYYVSAQGLHSTDGRNSASTIVVADLELAGHGFCNTTGKLRYLSNTGKIIEIESGVVSELDISPLATGVQACLDDSMIFWQNIAPNTLEEKIVTYDYDTKNMLRMSNLRGLIGVDKTSILKNKAGVIFAFGATKTEPYSRGKLLKIELKNDVLAPINFLLDD